MPLEPQELIRLAFEAAKKSGRPNWYRMDVGVLKNRMLNVTSGGFRESDYGCTAFMEFVRGHSDILELDEKRRPPSVTLRGAHEAPELASEPVRKHVRPDLWLAVMDFSGGRRYVWDDHEGIAKPASDSAVGGPAMPTITVEQFTEWKRASEQTDLDTPEGRQRFNDVYGPGGRRRDERDFTWCLGPRPFHGREVLQVAGYTLPPGFHWDVSVPAHPKTITTPTERWEVWRYINIAPDAHLRGRPPHARKRN